MEKSNQEVIEECYEKYSDEIYRFIFLQTRNHELAKDLTHDTFLKVYKSLHTFRRQTSYKNWLYQSARHLIIDHFRKRNPWQFLLKKEAVIDHQTPEITLLFNESQKELYYFLGKLKRDDQVIIILRKIEELSIKETAEILNWTQSKVKTTLFRAMKTLKQQMEKEGYVNEPKDGFLVFYEKKENDWINHPNYSEYELNLEVIKQKRAFILLEDQSEFLEEESLALLDEGQELFYVQTENASYVLAITNDKKNVELYESRERIRLFQ